MIVGDAKRATVLGASGFIGSHLAQELRAQGVEVATPGIDHDLRGEDLGAGFYCIGVTADFRSRPFDTVESHVSKFARVLEETSFESLVYLSSTRIYGTGHEPGHEDDGIIIRPWTIDHLYNLSKLLAESLANASGKPVKAVRLSNVYGADLGSQNFLSSILSDAARGRKITLHTSMDSSKDYINVNAATARIARIGFEGDRSLYNVASGTNVTNRELADCIRTHTDVEIETAPDSPMVAMAPVDITRVVDEFGPIHSDVLADLPALIDLYREEAGR